MFDLLNIKFPVSGVETNILIPPLVALTISLFTSIGGISGAFIILPFQVSVLNYTAPSVSGTNHVYNIVAIPSGIYRYIKEGRMNWPLTWVIIAGTLPGVFIGYYIRIIYLPDPSSFKLFAGLVLLYTGILLLRDLIGIQKKSASVKAGDEKFRNKMEDTKESRNPIKTALPAYAIVKTVKISLKKVEYEFCEERFSFSTIGMFTLALIIGIIGGAYGIGGGAILAPFCITFFHLPVYTIAGATLMGTFITSFAGALFFTFIPIAGAFHRPDWLLGILFGLGGFVGMYFGARLQKYLPQKFIKGLIGTIIIYVAITYILQYFNR